MILFDSKKAYEDSWLLYLLLTLACMNFLGRGPVIFLIYGLYGIVIAKSFVWTNRMFPYMIMSLAAFVSSAFFLSEKELIKAFVYFFSYATTLNGYIKSFRKELYIKRTIYFSAIGFSIALLLCYYKNFVQIEHVSGSRLLYNFWTNEPIPVTLIGLCSCVPLIVSVYILYNNNNLLTKFVGVFIAMLSILINAETATRTPFLILVITLIYIFWELFRKANIPIKILFFVCIVTIIIIVDSVLISELSQTPIWDRFSEDGVNSSRSNISLLYLDYMTEYPFGGRFAERLIGQLPHNYLQQSYDSYGVIFFIPLLYTTLRGIKNCLIVYKIKNEISILLRMLGIGVLLQILMEPVITGYPQLFWFYFILNALTDSYVKEYK